MAELPWLNNAGKKIPIALTFNSQVEVVEYNEDRYKAAAKDVIWSKVKYYRLLPKAFQTGVPEVPKQERYQDVKGEDWIDECARTFTMEEFRGAMKFTIGKYVRRCGKKDDIEREVGKIADYAQRWLKYEEDS